MKLFQQLLVAPAALGLLANYSENNLEIDLNSFKQKSSNNTLISGGEGLVESSDFSGGFSETTTASDSQRQLQHLSVLIFLLVLLMAQQTKKQHLITKWVLV